MGESREFETIPLLESEKGKAVVRQICGDVGIAEDVFWSLVRAELKQIGRQRKHGLSQLFDDAFAPLEQDHVDS